MWGHLDSRVGLCALDCKPLNYRAMVERIAVECSSNAYTAVDRSDGMPLG